MQDKIILIKNKIRLMNEVELDKVHNFIQSIDISKSDIKNEMYLDFNWLEEINDDSNIINEESKEHFNKLNINRGLK
ncbi:MAG: hypothetical protein NTW25_16530 [Candidatus Kapabacteria bacterium]|nr:hypothetical protein [Candidatus Kapabacteria bacterium]